MAVPIFLFSVFILGLLLLILLAGCSFYLFRNYCATRSRKAAKTTSTDRRQQGLEAANKTTTDDENTLSGRRIKTHTFDQILKQEEHSAYSVHPLDLQAAARRQVEQAAGGGADTQPAAAQAAGQQSARGSA